MIKIFLSVRNRLGITVKCIEAIRRHTTSPFQIYVYNNQTNYLVEEHFNYFCKLYQKGVVAQVTFNTDASTFNAFSKASACNMFGLQHEQDPQRDKCSFILMLDNDIILTPGWDVYVKDAWKYVTNKGLSHIKVIGQLPGGIKSKIEHHDIRKELKGIAGVLGGSGLWAVKNNFFRDVGYLDLRLLVGQNKRHDQLYWQLLQKVSPGKPYIMGLDKKLGIHCGKLCGSVCNTLTRNKNKQTNLDLIKFEDSDKSIRKVDFDSFYNKIVNDQMLIKDW